MSNTKTHNGDRIPFNKNINVLVESFPHQEQQNLLEHTLENLSDKAKDALAHDITQYNWAKDQYLSKKMSEKTYLKAEAHILDALLSYRDKMKKPLSEC